MRPLISTTLLVFLVSFIALKSTVMIRGDLRPHNIEEFLRLAESSDLHGIKCQLRAGIPINGTDRYGRTPLMAAAEADQFEAAKALIDAGADVNAKAKNGWTSLHSAAQFGNKPLVQILLEHGAATDNLDKRGRTPMDWAELEGQTEVIALLSSSGQTHVKNTKAFQPGFSDQIRIWSGILHLIRRDKGDFEIARKRFSAAIDAGDPKGHFWLAIMYHFGNGIPSDEHMFIKHLTIAAGAGDTDAMIELAAAHLRSKQYAEAVVWMEKAKAAGDARGWRYLSLCYLDGTGVEKDPAKALDYLRYAAEKNDVGAMTPLAAMYVNAHQADEALPWLKKAVVANQPKAMTLLSMLYATGTGVQRDIDQADALFKRAEASKALSKAELDKVRKILKASKQTPPSNTQLIPSSVDEIPNKSERAGQEMGMSTAKQLMTGSLTILNTENKDLVEQAIKTFTNAANAGDPQGHFFLGLMYRHGRGVPQNDQIALEHLTIAAEAGNDDAMMELAGIHWLANRFDEAIPLMEKARQAGNPKAFLVLGICYYEGTDIKQDIPKGISYLREAAEKNNQEAWYRLSMAYLQTNQNEKALFWLRKAVDVKHPEAMHLLGTLYSNGIGVPRDTKQAELLFNRAEVAKQSKKARDEGQRRSASPSAVTY